MIFRKLYAKQMKCFFSTQCQPIVRVRFAPSPTGYLHLGGLRTALYNFLFAQRTNGKFILRIEDTDQTRLVKGAQEQLQRDLEWAGIVIDEGPMQGGGYGPYNQSERLNIYRKHIEILLKNKSAYRCFCTEKRLDLLRREALKVREIPKYDNKCRDLSDEEVHNRLNKNQPHCIRFKLNSGCETFDDLIYGSISYDVTQNEGDPVILKSDGFPTYHFANVVDDHCMEISHVLRGVEWQISTTKHLLLYRAFNWKPPLFGHLPLLLNSDGTKLSKRQGDIQINGFRKNGIFPLALINFIASSGGGFDKDLEREIKPKIYSLPELAGQFDLNRIHSHSGKVYFDRLNEFNRLEIKRQLENSVDTDKLVREIQWILEDKFPENIIDGTIQSNSEYIKNILHWSVDRINKLSDLFSNNLLFIWNKPINYSTTAEEQKQIEIFIENLSRIDTFNKISLNTFIKKFCKENAVNYRSFMKVLRKILSGLKEGPSVAEMMEILGKMKTFERLQSSLNKTVK